MTESRLKPPLAAGSQIPFSRPPTPHASSDPPRLGFCGLGAMGRPMARNLATHQRSDALPVLVYNRTAAKAQALADELGPHKAAVAAGPEQIARECDIVVTNLGDDAAVMSIYQRFAAALKVRRIFGPARHLLHLGGCRIRTTTDPRSLWKHRPLVRPSFPHTMRAYMYLDVPPTCR